MAAANLGELPSWASDLLERSPLGHLSYVDGEDRPRVLPVTFAVAEGTLWTAIDQKPKRRAGEVARVRYLRRRPQAALCVDHYEDDWSRLAWVQAVAAVEIVDSEAGHAAATAGLERLCEKYRHYREDPPHGPFIALRPHRMLCWSAAGAS